MIAEATLEPSLFDAIIVHSRSRFFRDLFECLRYERLLKRAAVRVLSITQQTSDDASGELNSKIISMFDEYQSKENGKHTLRAMRAAGLLQWFAAAVPLSHGRDGRFSRVYGQTLFLVAFVANRLRLASTKGRLHARRCAGAAACRRRCRRAS